MATAAQDALFAEFGNEAQSYRPLSEIIPNNEYGSKAFNIKFQNGSLLVEDSFASDFQIRTFVQKANEMGLGFKVEGSRGNLRISSILASDVQPEFFERFSTRKANQSPAAQAYRAERQLDGQEPATGEAANDAIKSLRERNTDHTGKQSRSVRIGPSHVDEQGVVHGVLQTEVTANQNSTSGGRVQVSHSSAVTLTVNIPFTVTPVGGSYELKVETPREVGGRRNGLPVPQEHMHGAEVAAQSTLGEMFGNGVKQGKTFVTPQMLNEAHGKRVEVARAADRVVMNTLEQVFASSVPEAPLVETAAPVPPPAVEEVRDVAKPAPQEAPAAVPIAAEAEPQRAPAQLGRTDGPGLGQGVTLGEASSGVSVPSLGTVNANPAADIPEDFWKSLIPKDPDPIHLPLSGLSPKELEDLRRNLENTSSDVPSSERGAVIDAYRSLQFSPASKQALDEIQVRLNDNIRNALESDPELQRATREWSGMSIEEKIKALKTVETAVGAAYGHNPSISYFDLPGLTSGENVAGRIAVNLHEKSLDAAIETIAHESHHTFQRDLAENINHLPDERLRSAAEIYKLNFSLVRKGAIGSNGDSFAYVYEPIESDARRAGYGARDVVEAHIKNASVPDKVASHKSNDADLESMLADYDKQQLLVEVTTKKGHTYGVILPDEEQATSLQRALIEKGVATEVFEHNNQRVVRIRTGSLDAFKALVPPSVDLGDVDKLTLGHSTEAKSPVASESQPPVATATPRQRPPLERRMMDPDGMAIDQDMQARLAERRAEREAQAAQQRGATEQHAPVAEAPKPVVAEPAPVPPAPAAEVKPTETAHAPAADPVAKPHGVERVGKGAGVGLGVMGLAGRAGTSGSLSTAAKVGGDQLKSEVAAAGADAASIATDLADLGAKAGKAARVIGKASPIIAAGGAVLEVNAANHAQDGRRGAGAMTGFVGGMTGGAATGAVAGTAGAGPVGTVVGGIGGAVVGGYLASEAGQRSEWGDQRQINLDRVAQHRMDADTEKLQQLAKKDPQKWTAAEKTSARDIGEHMRQHAERMGALQLPETDVDGRLRQEAQKKQAMEAVEYLNGTKPASVLKTSAEKSEVAARSIDALLPKLNDPEKGWLRRLDADMDGKVSRADVLATLSKHGVAVHSLDKDGNGITEEELLPVLKAVRVKAPTRDAVLQNIAETKASVESERIEKAIDPKTYQSMEKAGLGALMGNGDSQVTLKEVLDTFKKNGMTLADTDRNGDGKISAEEMTKALQAHGISAPGATPNTSAKSNGTAASRG